MGDPTRATHCSEWKPAAIPCGRYDENCDEDDAGCEDGELTGHAVDGYLAGAGHSAGALEDDLLAGAGRDGDRLRLPLLLAHQSNPAGTT